MPISREIEAERVERRLDGEVELRGRGGRLVVFRNRLLVRRCLVLLTLDELDVVLDQMGVEVFDLLLRELDLFETADDLVIGEEALLLTVGDELLELFDLREWRDFDGEQVGDLRLVVSTRHGDERTSQCCRPVTASPPASP